MSGDESDVPGAAEFEAAIEALAEPGRMTEAEGLVARMAPQLQTLLGQVLKDGGWFEDAHRGEILKAATHPDPDERITAVQTLLAEETRLGMLIGVAVGWQLARELGD